MFVVRYADDQIPSELRRSVDGQLLAILSGSVAFGFFEPSTISFSPDEQASIFVVEYQDGHYELRDWRYPGNALHLDFVVKDHLFAPGNQRVVVWYTDGRAYLLDVAWLHRIGMETAQLTNQELLDFTCQQTIGSGLWSDQDQADLLEALDGKPAHPCDQ